MVRYLREVRKQIGSLADLTSCKGSTLNTSSLIIAISEEPIREQVPVSTI